jgi:hypothetical protein
MTVPRTELDFNVVVSEEDRPSGLTTIQGAGRSKIKEVLVVSDDLDTVLGPSEIRPPFLES